MRLSHASFLPHLFILRHRVDYHIQGLPHTWAWLASHCDWWERGNIPQNTHTHTPRSVLLHSVSYHIIRSFDQTHLNGMAVNWLAPSVHIHSLGDLEDVVWHVSCKSSSVSNLPPLLPVIQNLSKNTFRQLRTFSCHRGQFHTELSKLISTISCLFSSEPHFSDWMLVFFVHTLTGDLFRKHRLTDVSDWPLFCPVYMLDLLLGSWCSVHYQEKYYVISISP